MRQIKIDWTKQSYPPNVIYENSGIKFSWLTKPKTPSSPYLQVTNWHQCRETFANEICRLVGNKECGAWVYERKIDFKKTRVAIVHKHGKDSFMKGTLIDKKWMRCSIRILNTLEKSQGWTLSTVYKCDDITLLKYATNVFVFISSPKWMQAPQLLSLYLLILRLGNFWKIFSKFKQVSDLENIVKEISAARHIEDHLDLEWVENTWKYWMLLLNNHKELFFNNKLDDNFKSNTGFCGIQSLINESYCSIDILTAWRKIIPKNCKE